MKFSSRITPEVLAVARGDAPADLVLSNARIVNVFSGEIEAGDIAICKGVIAGVGTGYSGNEQIDLKGAYVAPGLIDAHVHIESSLCVPPQFAAAVLPRGVTTVIADPHEIANVCGAAGIRFMADASRDLPLRVVLMAPSCIPATPMGTSGAKLTADDLVPLLKEGIVHGLAEVMNFPGVIKGDAEVLAKIQAFEDRPIDGHCPRVRGRDLNAYVAGGINSDHECVDPEEAKEKLARGMYVLIREATNARNLAKLLPIVTPANSRRICLCTDDRQPADLLGAGGIDHMVRQAIAFGLDPITAIQIATLNVAECFRLRDRGAIAPGRGADLIVFDDLKSPSARQVYVAGALVAENGQMSTPLPQTPVPKELIGTCRINWPIRLEIAAQRKRIRVIGVLPDQLITEDRVLNPMIRTGSVLSDVYRDVLKVAVIERHQASGKMGIGFVQGFNLKEGALAGTIAHDHHNLIVVGCDDMSMTQAIKTVERMGGGLAAVVGEQVLASLALPVAGLMSEQPIQIVREDYDKLLGAARQMGATLHDPFMAMSFIGLEVIPSLKITDQGLVDVEKFQLVNLFV